MNQKLSVIIPVYNGENFIKKCLDSVLAQTYKNLEILCIVDGSKDSSTEIIKNYAEKDSRIKLIEQENQGVCKTRNNGIEIATGELITFLDHDDFIEPNMYFEMIQKMEKENSDISICSIEYIGKTNEILGLANICDKYKFLEEGNLLASVCNKIFKKSIINKLKLRFLENRQIGEDLDFAFRYMISISNVSFIDKPFYKYVKHSESNLSDKDKRINIFYCMKNSYDFINENFEKNSAEYKRIMTTFNKIFKLHAIDYAFCNLPNKNKKQILKISETIKKISTEIELEEDVKNKLNRQIFLYEHKYLKKIWKLFNKKSI